MPDLLHVHTERSQAGSEWPYPDQPYYTPVFVVGGNGGSTFLDARASDGLFIKSLEFWTDDDKMAGVRATYSDGSQTSIHGQTRGDRHVLTLAPGELILELTIWGNGVGTRCGKVEIKTSLKQHFSCGKKSVSGQTPYDAPTGSGLLVGIEGRSGNDLDALGFFFLNPVDTVTLRKVEYVNPPGQGSDRGIAPAALLTTHYGPYSDRTEYRFADSVKRTMTRSWTSSTSMKYFASIKVSAEVFGVGTSANAGWERTTVEEVSQEESTEVSLPWDVKGVLEPGQEVTLTAEVRLGSLDLQYTAELVAKIGNDTYLTFPASGTFTNIAYGTVYVTKSFA